MIFLYNWKKILYPCGVVVPVIEDDLDEVEVSVEVEIDGPEPETEGAGITNTDRGPSKYPPSWWGYRVRPNVWSG